MVFRAYEALVNEVKALKEENKRLRNVRTTSEVELQPKTRDRKASRNSWADIYNETTALQTQNAGAGGRDRRMAGMARQVGSTRGDLNVLDCRK